MRVRRLDCRTAGLPKGYRFMNPYPFLGRVFLLYGRERKNMTTRRDGQGGFMLLEVLIAAVVIVVLVLAFIGGIVASFMADASSHNTNTSVNVARQTIEEVLELSFGDILTRARYAPVCVDLNSLHRRRLDMYANRTFTDALAGHASGVSPAPLPTVDEPLPYERYRALGTITPVAVLLVVLGSFLVWWRRQMKHAAGPKAQLLRLRKHCHARTCARRLETHVKLIPHHR